LTGRLASKPRIQGEPGNQASHAVRIARGALFGWITPGATRIADHGPTVVKDQDAGAAAVGSQIRSARL